jgi:2-keto-3-deoxy-galactonokinase
VNVDWIAVDWGTSQLRAWAFDADGRIGATAASADGMGKLGPEEFEPALLKQIGDWLPQGRRVPVLACGMVGARRCPVRRSWPVVSSRRRSAIRASRCISCRGSARRRRPM